MFQMVVELPVQVLVCVSGLSVNFHFDSDIIIMDDFCVQKGDVVILFWFYGEFYMQVLWINELGEWFVKLVYDHESIIHIMQPE